MGSELQIALQSTEVVIFIILVGAVSSMITGFVAIIGLMVKINDTIKTCDAAYSEILNKKNKEIRELTNDVIVLRGDKVQLLDMIKDIGKSLNIS